MSDNDLKLNASIELSDIRKLDSLLTQCETSSCENICIDCCAKLGSLDDDEYDHQIGNSQDSNDSAIIPSPSDIVHITNEIKRDKPMILRQSAISDETKESIILHADVINKVPTIISSYVSSDDQITSKQSTLSSTHNNNNHSSHNITKFNEQRSKQISNEQNDHLKLNFGVGGSGDNTHSLSVESIKKNDTKYCTRCGGIKNSDSSTQVRKENLNADSQEHNNQLNKGNSENPLECQKQSSLESYHKCSSSVKQLSLSSACDKCDNGKLQISTNCEQNTLNTSKLHSNRSQKDKSDKSSQLSSKDGRSRKNSIFRFNNSGDDNDRRKRSKQYHRKASTRGPYLHEEFDAETLEILLGGTHTSKLEVLKIPEPVEAVRKFETFFLTLVILSLKRGQKKKKHQCYPVQIT